MSCPTCHKETSRRICPECSAELPYTWGQQKEHVISIIGAKESGKSHYIAVLLDKIMKQMSLNFKCSLQALNDETIHRYREDFYNPIYKRKETLNVTLSGRTNDMVKKPLLYNLSFYGKDFWGRKKISSVITLAFFDTAGEDLNNEDTMSTVNKYIYNSSGIILLLDPLQFTDVREYLKRGSSIPQQNTDPYEILTRTINIIHKGQDIPAQKLIDIPLAVTLSKLDALNNADIMFDESSVVKHPSPHIAKGSLQEKEFPLIYQEIRTFLTNFGGSNFVSLAESKFQKHSFFGISALGKSPQGTNKIDVVNPHRVEDPFLWLLSKNKILK
ncbi:hypothetical protein [Paenibacillus cremeus]|uniref:hypothetical protein n=1 Tax=Paenibacillus cremeus TaxID=2163881 RepID=UPI001C941AD6|nr:hypothetical protein [Paenibacillus cremeus]